MSWCHLYAAGVCVAAACSKRLTGHTRGFDLYEPCHCCVEVNYISVPHALLPSGTSGPWTRCDNSLGSFVFVLCSLKMEKYFTAKLLLGLIKIINPDFTITEDFFTLCCSHPMVQNDQTNKFLSFFFPAWQTVKVRILHGFVFLISIYISWQTYSCFWKMCTDCVTFRYDSSGESATDKPLGRTSSYTRRETRLGALNRQEEDPATKDYKKVTLTFIQSRLAADFKTETQDDEVEKLMPLFTGR